MDRPGLNAMSPGLFRWACLFEAGLAALALLLGRWFAEPAFGRLTFDATGIIGGLLSVFPPFLFLVWSQGSAWAPMVDVRRFLDERVLPMFRPLRSWQLALLCLLAGVGEESLFRGVLQPVLGRPLGPVGGLLAASFLFGLVHWVTPAYALLTMAVGAYFGALMWSSGNLLVPILSHAVYDFVAIAFLLRRAAPTGEAPS